MVSSLNNTQDVFLDFLNQNFKHLHNQDLSFEIWKAHVRCSPKLAGRRLVSFHEMLKSPPANFEDLFIDHGHVRFMHDFDLPTERDFTEEEVLAWAKATYLKFVTYFFENSRPSILKELKHLQNLP